MVNGMYLYSTFLVFSTTQSAFTTQFSIHPIHTHIHALRAGKFSTKSQPAQRELIHTHTHQWRSHQEQFGVQYLAQRHFNMWTGETGDQTTGLLIGRRPALPTEQQLAKSARKSYNCKKSSLIRSHTKNLQCLILEHLHWVMVQSSF